MDTLKKNISNIYGSPGKQWLQQLPDIIDQLNAYWSLTHVQPVANMNYNYIAKALQNNTPVVLKISCDNQSIKDEYKALKHFDGHGSIKVLDIHNELNALLLAQAIPGNSIKTTYLNDMEKTILIYADIVNAIASRPLINDNHKHVSKWCEAIDRIKDGDIDQHYIKKAQALRDYLLSTTENEYLCHGDLHLENIINHDDKWLSIDPKGVIGEMAFEANAFDLTDKSEWHQENIQEIIIERINLLADTLKLDRERVLAWAFLRTIISAQWFIEDNGDPSDRLHLANVLYPLIAKNNNA
ncbi:MAG: aminoglycoside phosphotransferase family protein [Gammaproteobacteria bacterium]|nr:aminoglycoside phosphotransferase family protein [Gammaproteobacteria bacterium]MCH9744780.1 aminoglycoside phosphotransferase family protein [Gammaproteobacteria bacterium]